MFTKTLSFFVLLVLTAPFNVSAFAQLDDANRVIINPNRVNFVTVDTNDEVVLQSGWGACNLGLIYVFLKGHRYEWTLNGEPLFTSQEEISQYWGAPEPSGPDADASACVAANPIPYWVYWTYSLGQLDAGTYEVTLVTVLKHPLIDGGDYNEDGHPDLFSGGFGPSTVTIVVTE